MIQSATDRILDIKQHAITLLRLAGQFQADELIDRCTRALLENGLVKQDHSFVERLKAADELQMDQFRVSKRKVNFNAFKPLWVTPLCNRAIGPPILVGFSINYSQNSSKIALSARSADY